ncbi:MAG: hypothetical protein WAW61_12250, partial [Methylococcaceae bacterium]
MNEKKQTNVSKHRKTQGESPTEVRNEITRLYQSAQNGASFVAALKASNYSLVKSTRGVIFIIDRKGGEHNLIKRIEAPRKEIESKFADIQIANLPLKKSRKREGFIKCFLTPAEKAEIKTRANQAELTASGYLRSLFFGKNTQQPKASRRPAAEKVELVNIRYELRKIGEKLTQIAHMQNQDGGFDTVAYTQLCDQHNA